MDARRAGARVEIARFAGPVQSCRLVVQKEDTGWAMWFLWDSFDAADPDDMEFYDNAVRARVRSLLAQYLDLPVGRLPAAIDAGTWEDFLKP